MAQVIEESDMNDQPKPMFAGIKVICMPELPANTMMVSTDVFELLQAPEGALVDAADQYMAEMKQRFAEVTRLMPAIPENMEWPEHKGSEPASSHKVIDARAPATHPKPADEKAYLEQMIFKLAERGWKPCAYNDGDGYMPIDTAVRGLHWIIEQVSATDHAWLQFKNADGKTKTVMLIWGNDPHGEELFADHAMGEGFEEAVDAAHKEIFPED